MAPHSSTLAWKIPWMEEPGRLQSMGSLSRIRLSNFTFTFHFHAIVYTLSVNVTRRLSYLKLFSNSQELYHLSHPVFLTLYCTIDPYSWSPKSSHNRILFPNLMFLFCIQAVDTAFFSWLRNGPLRLHRKTAYFSHENLPSNLFHQ